MGWIGKRVFNVLRVAQLIRAQKKEGLQNMKMIFAATCTLLLLIPGPPRQDSHPQTSDNGGMHMHHPTEESNAANGTIIGYVRDIACLLRNPKAGAATKPLTQDCLQKCVHAGSPIGILTEDGSLYMPISAVIPDTSVRTQLLPYAGKYVKASGELFERGGMHAISVQKIEVIERPRDSEIPIGQEGGSNISRNAALWSFVKCQAAQPSVMKV
jgi:hypothetical protein